MNETNDSSQVGEKAGWTIALAIAKLCFCIIGGFCPIKGLLLVSKRQRKQQNKGKRWIKQCRSGWHSPTFSSSSVFIFFFFVLKLSLSIFQFVFLHQRFQAIFCSSPMRSTFLSPPNFQSLVNRIFIFIFIFRVFLYLLDAIFFQFLKWIFFNFFMLMYVLVIVLKN